MIPDVKCFYKTILGACSAIIFDERYPGLANLTGIISQAIRGKSRDILIRRAHSRKQMLEMLYAAMGFTNNAEIKQQIETYRKFIEQASAEFVVQDREALNLRKK